MEDLAEVVGALRLPLGGLNGYLSVRGKQGRKRDKYQGCSPNKTRRTKLFKTLRQAAIAFAKLMKDTENDPIAHLVTSRRLRWVRVVCCASLPAPRWRVLGCI